MAIRRMFSKQIINSARFIKMPTSSQLLYFHLSLNADDDGVVEGYNVMRMINCTEDDLHILVAKSFVIVMNEDLVTYITDWTEHNLIRPDRKVDSIYKNLLIKIIADGCQTSDGQLTDGCQHRVGKDRVVKDSIDKVKKPLKINYADNVKMLEVEYTKLITQYTKTVIDEKIIDLSLWKGSKGKNTKSDYLTLLTWLRKDTKTNTPAKEDTWGGMKQFN